MRSIQEQEELDYDPQREELNCLSEARSGLSQLNARFWSMLDRLLARGLFVVAVSGPYYCRSTDAFAGELHEVVASFATREEAEVFASQQDSECGSDGSFGVFPKLLVPQQPVPEVCGDDEIPF